MVKNAILSSENQLIIVTHYKTKIIEYNTVTLQANIILGLSATSNRQIANFIEVFKPKKVVNLNEKFKLYPKNYFSEPITL